MLANAPSRCTVGACACACASICIACLCCESSAWAEPCQGSIDLHVVDRSTHDPIVGATVRGNERLLGLSDEAGRFTVAKLCGTSITLSVSQDGYQEVTQELGLTRPAALEIALKRIGRQVLVREAPVDPPSIRSVTEVSGEALERTRGRSFSDALAEVPGVSQLRSATGLSKPVVRGLAGRRLPLLVDSVRHRSQDWGIDHAPEVDPFVADRLTVVRGAAGVRYGPDAIGGAVLAHPPALRFEPGVAGEVHAIGNMGRGGSLAARWQGGSQKIPGLAWRMEASGRRLTPPSTPDYVLGNTALREWSVGGALGYRTENHEFSLSARRYGLKVGLCFCLRFETGDDFMRQLEQERPIDAEFYESDFDIERPRQEATHDLALARARFRLPRYGSIIADYAFQLDERTEFDTVRASTSPQLSFQLFSNDLSVRFEHNPYHLSEHIHLRGEFGLVGTSQTHNFNGITLIPGYQAFGAGVFAIERLIADEFELEAGVRYDALTRSAPLIPRDYRRLIRSDQLEVGACGVEDPESLRSTDRVNCDSAFHTFSASLGGLYRVLPDWSLKLSFSTASRPPNPDEQYLNGAAPSFPVLALGKPDLSPETTYGSSLSSSYQGDKLAVEASAYANFISDYIYLAPAINEMGQPVFDVVAAGAFPRFVTRPVNAVFYGADGGVTARPVPQLELRAQASLVRAKNTSDDTFLVFVPPDRYRGSFTYRGTTGAKVYLTVGSDYVTRQTRFDIAADLAPPPDAYLLVDAEVGGQTAIGEQTAKFALTATNIFGARYRDYTSLIRYFADAPGMQFMARMTVLFNQ